MNMKTLVLVIIFSVLVGVTIFFVTGNKNSAIKNIVTKDQNLQNNTQQSSPTPKPKITFPPLTKDSNLEEELEKITPEDFSESIKKLRENTN